MFSLAKTLLPVGVVLGAMGSFQVSIAQPTTQPDSVDAYPSKDPLPDGKPKDLEEAKTPKEAKELEDPKEAKLPEEPALPMGMDDGEPTLPMGMNDGEPGLPSGMDDSEPALPSGMSDDEEVDTDKNDGFSLPFRWKVVFDLRGGTRIHDAIDQKATSLGEARLQLHIDKDWELWESNLSITADFVGDPVLGVYEIDLETGDGAIDLREASVVLSPLDFVDLKLGRQILTWGTGDYLFINDLFPKDWNAFLIGREVDYLKAPSDALKLSVFHDFANVDIVMTPRFDTDRYPDRRRLSSFDPASGAIVGRDTPIPALTPTRVGKDRELAGRMYREIRRFEVAAYAYRGFWKSPAGANPSTGEATFPKLSVYGASVRGSLLGGIINAEAGYYDSREDRKGNSPFVRNSEVRSLVGYERELFTGTTLGLQYYQEYMRSHDSYKEGLPVGAPASDRIRHLVSFRLSGSALRQRLRLGIFVMGSPNEKDIVMLPSATYSLSDVWRLHMNANIFAGKSEPTFFGQLESNSSVSAGLRGSY